MTKPARRPRPGPFGGSSASKGWRAGRHARGEDGFSLLEAMFALTVLFAVLVVLGQNLLASFASVAFAHQRQTATALADQAIEAVRGLPFDDVVMDSDDLAASSDIDACATPVGEWCFRGKVLARRDTDGPRAPLSPHRSTVPSGGTTFTVSTYVTVSATAAAADARDVTVVVTWDRPGRGGVSPQVESSTTVTRAGCGEQDGPRTCGVGWHADAQILPGQAHVTGTILGRPAVDLVVQLAGADSGLTVEQRTAARSGGRMPGARLAIDGLTPSTAGGATAAADVDDSDPDLAYQDDPAGPSIASFVQVDSDDPTLAATLTATTPANATTEAVAAAIAASQTPVAGGPVDSDRLGYARGRATAGGDVDLTADVTGPAGPLPTMRLLHFAASSSAQTATVDREPGADPEDPSDDWVSAIASRSLGSSDLFGLPAGTEPGGWDGAYVHATGISGTVSAVAGPGVSSGDSLSVAGSLRWWNGSGYTSTSVSGGAIAPIALPSVTVTSGGCDVTVGGRIGGGGRSSAKARIGGGTSGPIASSRNALSAPLSASFTHRVVCGGVTVIDLAIDVDLGGIVAEAGYTAP